MKTIRLFLLLGALLCGALLVASCNKANLGNNSNPVAVSLPAADFGITILDCEHGYDRDSNYVFEGEWKDGAFRFGLDRTEEMVPNITPDNAITFRITSDSPSFQGVNASSSKGGINIVQDGSDHTVYHLEWVAEGESDITFWNGEGEARKELKFKATSKKEIPMTGIKVRCNNIETRFERKYATEYEIRGAGSPLESKAWLWQISQSAGTHVIDGYASEISNGWDGMAPVEIFPVPLNATPKKYIADFFASGAVPDETKSQGYRRVENEELCSENAEHFDGFSWISPSSYHADFPANTMEAWAEVHRDCQSVYPCDIRERRLIIPYTRKQIDCTHIAFFLYSGNLRDFSLGEVEQFTFYN